MLMFSETKKKYKVSRSVFPGYPAYLYFAFETLLYRFVVVASVYLAVRSRR